MPTQKARPPADPDRIKLTPIQAERLGALADVSAKELVGLHVGEISEKFRFRIDPTLLLFRRICGRVVKRNLVTGVEYPVPHATVHVEDTDCSLLGFFPTPSPWAWYFPFRCRREVIATAKTDECGRFCVWIPRWDIDWVLHFRLKRVCFPVIFERPSIGDLLEEIIPRTLPVPRPRPGDPPPFLRAAGDPARFHGMDRGQLIRLVEDHLGREVARDLDLLDSQATFGASTVELETVLETAAFEQRKPPPLPAELLMGEYRGDRRGKEPAGLGMEGARSTLAARLKVDAEEFARLDLRTFIGPFKRCFDVLIPEWVPILDVPDITFRVTQDTDGDGVEETIYSEGYFQVRWNASVLGPIKIRANENARAGLDCEGFDVVPCADVPAIVLAGRMPVVSAPTIYNPARSSGYALRPNRPHPSGLFSDPLPNPPAESPFAGAVSLLGCYKTDPAATHYRVVYEYSSDKGATFTSPPVPFVGLTWPLFRLDASGNLEWHYPASDANGWYLIALPAGPNPFLPTENLLLDWPTYAFANGRYVLKLELGTGGSSAATSSSAEVAFNIDNGGPLGPLTIEWRKKGSGVFQLLTLPCPLVKRGSTPKDLEFRVTLDASATHLRAAKIAGGGCGGGDFVLVSGTTEHWHVAPADNAVLLQAIFELSAGALAGTYSFSGEVSSRAFNPNGGDGGHLLTPPWEYNPGPIHINPAFAFSVVNED